MIKSNLGVIMIITESQLEQIVREELSNLQQEAGIKLPSMPTYMGTKNASNRSRPYPRKKGLSDQEPIKAKKTLAQRLGLGKDWESEAEKTRPSVRSQRSSGPADNSGLPRADAKPISSMADRVDSRMADRDDEFGPGPESMTSGPGFDPSNPGAASFDGPEFQGSKDGHGDAVLGMDPADKKNQLQKTLKKQLRRNVNRATAKQDPTKMISDIVRNVLRVMGELDVQLEEGELYEAIKHELSSVL